MAKKIHFALLFSTFFFPATTTFALENLEAPEKTNLNVDYCDAPAPDSFRVTVASSTFVTLAWRPVWEGSTHTLILLIKEDQSLTWTPVDTFFNVPGTKFTVPISPFELSKVGFLISTNCANGEIGVDTKLSSPPIGFILDLTLGGITPANPNVVETCSFFSYLDNSWMGFSIGINGTPSSGTNLFQLKVQENLVVIKRVYGTPIVVGDFDHHHPKDPAPTHILFSDMPRRFLAYQITGENNFVNIGGMSVELVASDKTIKVCKSPMPVWNNNFKLTILNASPPGLLSNFNENHFKYSPENVGRFVVQTPFVGTLNIYTPDTFTTDRTGNISCKLCNSSGQLILEQEFEAFSNQVSISTETLLPGLYVLRIAAAGEVQTFKVIKSGR